MINLKKLPFILLSALFITFVCSCGNHQHATAEKQSDTTKQHAEYIAWDSVRINGTAGAVSTPKVLYSAIGKPDSVVKPDMTDVCVSFFDQPFKYVYIKGSEFEMRGDSIVISKLDLKNNSISVTCKGLKLDKNTTLASLAQTFPDAAKRKYPLGVYGSKDMLTAITVGAEKDYKPGNTDGVWIMLFKDGKLVRMEYHLDC